MVERVGKGSRSSEIWRVEGEDIFGEGWEGWRAEWFRGSGSVKSSTEAMDLVKNARSHSYSLHIQSTPPTQEKESTSFAS